MPASEAHDRAYLQARIREEIGRSQRYGSPFAVVTFEALPVADGIPIRRKVERAIEVLEARLRPSDVIGRGFDDMVAVLLVETDAAGSQDALLRLRAALQVSSRWHITTYVYPRDAAAFEALPLLTAA